MFKLNGLLALAVSCAVCFSLVAEENPLPPEMQKIMQLEKYKHANWGVYAKDSETGEVLYDYHSNQLFLPGSTTKLFSVAALLKTYGDNYRFKTPVYAMGPIQNGTLQGDLILVAQGDLTMGGRQSKGSDSIAYTNMDHIYANVIPGATLTPQNPLNGLIQLAQDIQEKGIKQINGEIVIDTSLFQKTEKRDMILSPIIINDNLIDLLFQPAEIGKTAQLAWRPMVEGYTVKNEVKTVAKGEKLDIEITSDESGKNILVKGTLPADQKNLLRTFSIKNAVEFAKDAFIQALKGAGITVNLNGNKANSTVPASFKGSEPIAVWTSPPLTEYAKLILKVSHNLGADLIAPLLAVKAGGKTFDEGMVQLGKFTTEVVGVPLDSFVFLDAAGGDQNRLTPKAEVMVLNYVRRLPLEQFKKFDESLPILGIDGSLADFGKGSTAVGKVHAKPGTGVSYNTATGQFFLATQALAGYIEGQNGHLIEFMIAVNNGTMPKINDIFPIFEDFAQMTVVMYDKSK